jgi:hypothetical protein
LAPRHMQGMPRLNRAVAVLSIASVDRGVA